MLLQEVIGRVCRLMLVLLVLGAPAARALQPAPGSDEPERAAHIAPVWPERIAPAGDGAAKGIIREIEGPARWWGTRPIPRPPSLEDLVDAAALMGERGGKAGVGGVEFEFEGSGSFVFSFVPDEKATGADRPALCFRYVSGTPGTGPDGREVVRIERTWFALYEPHRAAPRGTALVIPGMFGTPEPVVESVVAALRKRGWAVVRMLSHPARFTERVVFDLERAGSPEQAAGQIAAEYGQRAAECAYAAQAALAFVAQRRPDLPARPRVAVGMSGGAMALSTVAAREPEDYDALVYIAGGANFHAINERSNYRQMIDAVEMRWGEDASPALKSRFDALYLERATLDAYHTATLLAGKPIYMLHAAADRAVPARLGDVLWERLGRPERAVVPVGHELLFAMLPGAMSGILDWLESAVE